MNDAEDLNNEEEMNLNEGEEMNYMMNANDYLYGSATGEKGKIGLRIRVDNSGAIKEVVNKILEDNPQSIADYKAGKDRALGFLVGQAMKETKGKANPQMLNEMFKEAMK